MLDKQMKNSTLQNMTVLALFAVAMASRLYTPFGGAHATWLQNFSPLAALCLCGAIYFPRKLAVMLPVSIIFLSDLFLNAHYHRSMFCTEILLPYVALGLVIGMGWAIRQQGRLWMVIPASLAGSFCFYVITNTGSWISDAGYQKNFAGWVQALTTGLPGYPPVWTFFRSTLISDLLFTMLFVICMAVTGSRTAEAELSGRAATAS